jgi:hypothetical protein
MERIYYVGPQRQSYSDGEEKTPFPSLESNLVFQPVANNGYD